MNGVQHQESTRTASKELAIKIIRQRESEIVLALAAPTLIGSEFVQVTSCPLALQVHPPPVPETNASPAGSVSVTVICCCVAAEQIRKAELGFVEGTDLPPEN